MDVLVVFQYICNSICIVILQKKLNNKTFFIATTIVNAMLVSLLYERISTLATIYSFFSTFFIYWLTKQDYKRYFYSIPIGLIFSILADYLSNVISLFFLGKITLGSDIEMASFHLIVSFSISLILAGSTVKLIKSYSNWPLLICSYGLLLTYYSIIVSSSIIDSRNSIFLMNVTFLFFYFILTGISVFLISQSLKQKYQSSIYKKEIEIQREYIRESAKSVENLRQFKHNYRNILYSLKILVDKTESIDLQNYFYENIYPTKELLSTKTVDNEKLDLILNESVRGVFEIKLMQSVIHNIEVELFIKNKVRVFEKLEYPLNEAIGIIMDNAIEEMMMNSFSSSFKINIFSKTNRIVFSFENPTTSKENLFLLKQRGYSTKSSGRGQGLSILDSIVESNPEFSLRTKISNNHFYQILILDKSKEKV